jgi:parallel beta-helix repeat protein
MDSELERGLMHVAGTPHGPILIDGDANFTLIAQAEGWSGNGMSGDPFIIDGLDIDLAGAPGHGISISNTRAHFVIRDSNLTGANVYPGSGIYLYNITNGLLINNTCANNFYAIHLILSNLNALVNNTCSSNYFGIYLEDSHFNTVSGSACTSNTDIGIYLNGSNSNSVVNNTCTGHDPGISLLLSNSNSVVNNTCTSNDFGILLENSQFNNVSENTCTSNVNVGIHLQISNSNTLTNNTCASNALYGIFLYSSVSNALANNTCTSNTNGIGIISSSSNTLSENTFTSNIDYGIEMDNSDFNSVANSSCRNNQYGIELHQGSDNNTVQWNVFADNVDNGVMGSLQLGNIFDYNYWSDYTGTDADANGFGDTAYTYTRIIDYHPLMYLPTPPRWTELPVDQTVEFWFSGLRYDLNVTCPSPVTWHLDHRLFSIDHQGVIESFSLLPVDIHSLRIVVTSIYGSKLITTILVNVLDTSPPGWLVIPTEQNLDNGESFDYQVAAIDPSGIDYWEINDTTHFILEASFYFDGSTARITSSSILEQGSYGLNLTVFDIYDNKLSVVFSVIMDADTTMPKTTTTPTTTEPTSPSSVGINPVMTFALGAGIGGAAVAVIVIVFLRRRP